MMHYGHANVLRQAKSFGSFLIAGVHSSEEIAKNKGPPVLTLDERAKLLGSVRWVDQVVINAPYSTSVKTLDKFGCDFCVHSEDIALTAEGVDAYAEIKAAGRYRFSKRTPGVSTTDLIGRIASRFVEDYNKNSQIKESPWTTMGGSCPTSQIIALFSSLREANSTDKIIYVPGAFDCFHIGHVNFLESIRKHGSYIIVGLYSDETIRRYKGHNFPIMTLHERLLSVLACKYVDNIVIDAPYNITSNFLERFKIDLVCCGQAANSIKINGTEDPYKEPKRQGKLKIVDSGCSFTVENLINRILKDRKLYAKRNQDKAKKEITQYNLWQKIQTEAEAK
ncbi:Ethanolamine-phosphate cytidylyltransferase [Trichoplax sp. H2]|nr:Ethanolamine-phosphate cytidylyltransferase [Trichoplax sp. H2]|eukprot:RDD45264.1 Ethanolamine-phosphate cytidylyltransferase [Trichoplax sp. H2]